MNAAAMIALNSVKLLISKLAPVILHDIWGALVQAWPKIKADILKDVTTVKK